MASQSTNVWQTSRSRSSISHSRTPQSRSGNASPAQQLGPAQAPPKQDANGKQQPAPSNNFWAQRAANTGVVGNANKANEAMGAPTEPREEKHMPENYFNADEIRSFLARNVSQALYKPSEGQGSRNSGNAWAQRPGTMSNGQAFFSQLAKQVAALEEGG